MIVVEEAARAIIAMSQSQVKGGVKSATIDAVLDGLKQCKFEQVRVKKWLKADISRAKKGGTENLGVAEELTELIPRVKSIQSGLASELSRVTVVRKQKNSEMLKMMNKNAAEMPRKRDVDEFASNMAAGDVQREVHCVASALQ